MNSQKQKKSKKKTQKVPLNCVAWYNKLYLERKGTTKSKFPQKLVEASKSWLSLNDSDKKYFYDKYTECKLKYNEKCLTSLGKAETFMKEKVKRRKSNLSNVTSNDDNYQHGNDTLEEIGLSPLKADQQEITDYGLNSPNNEECQQNIEKCQENIDECEQDIEEYEQNIEECGSNIESSRNNQEPSESLDQVENFNNSPEEARIILSEPAPPSIKNGKEMFEMVRFMGEKNDSAWLSLSQLERSRYTRAVLAIKKDYISKYTMYLENLSHRALYDHYNKILNCPL